RLAAAPAYALRELLAQRASRGQPDASATHGSAPAEEGSTHHESEAVYWAGQLERQLASWIAVADRYLPGLGGPVDAVAVAKPSASPNVARCAEEKAAAPSLLTLAADGHATASEVVARTRRLIALVDDLATELDMSFLYDPRRRLFSIGYNVDSW